MSLLVTFTEIIYASIKSIRYLKKLQIIYNFVIKKVFCYNPKTVTLRTLNVARQIVVPLKKKTNPRIIKLANIVI